MTPLRVLAVCLFAALTFSPVALGAPVKTAAVDPAFNPVTGLRPKVKVPFPPIADWNSLRISLERTPCYGTCPGYSVEIAGDGTVTYMGHHFVAEKGVRSAKIPQAAVRALFEAFVKADFFWSFDEYTAPITDLPTQVVSISFDGHSKSVLDYAGQHEGLPKAIADLEEAIDTAAGTGKWIGHEDRP
jgi:hypothetical protein